MSVSAYLSFKFFCHSNERILLEKTGSLLLDSPNQKTIFLFLKAN
ncbi:hypothetical protein CHCC20488_0302 [Bacillus paralicheniformis]|nr:hypothetical protein CHCC14523_3044 [Bacillus paralicheniformis]TWN82183.1 hypothetical protein CHCC20492_0092 [Bacillus paralicheniformis]TWN98122.1 hypothetical protein CHCC20488_0302 [Bacillus paralicheniformis]